MTDTSATSTQEIVFHSTSNDEPESNIEEFKEEEEEEGYVVVIDEESNPGNMTKASYARKSIQSSKSSTDGSERATSRPQKTAGLPPVPSTPKMASNKSPSSKASKSAHNTNKKASPSSQQNAKKKNKDFEDFEATGKWGKVSRKEMYLVGCVAISIVIAIVVGVVVIVVGNKQQQQQNSNNMPPEQPAAIVYPTLSQQEQLDMIRAALAENAITASSASAIPLTVDALDPNAWVDGLADPLVRAASWKVLQDASMDASNRIMERFALAAIYFETVGEEWENSAFWLNTDSNVCDGPWFGVRCINNDVVAELQLTGNNLQGNIPIALSLLPTLQSLWLDSNALRGKLNGDIFSAKYMPDMQFLYLQSNQLRGTIPNTFLSNGSDLRTIYIQGNNFTGGFPEEYCPTCESCPHPMWQFGLDCKKNPCPNEWCGCDPYNHCFD